MSAIDDRKRSFGIAALMVLGLVAGFLVATTAAGEEYATVGTVAEDNQAYAIPLEEDQRIRFTLDAAEDAANAEARFAVYDPQDRFFGAFTLDGDEDDVELLADQEGPWVVFVTDTLDAELAVQFAEDDRGANQTAEDVMTEIEVTSDEQTVAKQSGGALDEQLALRLDQRPATAFLEFEGDIAGLDATVTSQDGIVYEIQDAEANVTDDGAVHRSGQTEATPEHLAEGPYRIDATAESFSGTLTFVSQSYDRGADAPEEGTPEVPEPDPLADTTIVASVSEGEAYEIPMQGTQALLLAVKGDTSADVFVYNASDDLVETVELDGATYERSSEPDHDHENDTEPAHPAPPAPPEPPEEPQDNGSRDRVPVEVVRLNTTDAAHVVYVHTTSGDEETVLVGLPSTSAAERATELDVEAQQLAFPHDGNQSQTAEANLTGGLVGVEVHSQELFTMRREVNVQGPLGTIAHIEEQAKTFGISLYQDGAITYSNFSDGLMQVTFSQEGLQLAQGETTVELVHYVR